MEPAIALHFLPTPVRYCTRPQHQNTATTPNFAVVFATDECRLAPWIAEDAGPDASRNADGAA